MSEATLYESFKESIPGWNEDLSETDIPILQVAGITNPYGIECVTLVWDYANYLWPKVPFRDTITMGNAYTLFTTANPTYFTKIANDHNDPNQLPERGDVMVFGPTPAPGYTNQLVNPYGHVGIFGKGNSSSYFLLQQNAPNENEAPNVTEYDWLYRPCIGWLRPKVI